MTPNLSSPPSGSEQQSQSQGSTGGGKARGKAGGQKRGRRKVRNFDSYATYIHRVLKQTHEETGISNKAMSIMDSLVSDMFNRLCSEASLLTHIAKKNTMQAKDIAAAVKLVFPGELASHASSEAERAVDAYEQAMKK